VNFDPDYIVKVLEFLGHREAGGVTEVRIFPKDRYLFINKKREYVGKVVSGYYDEYEKLARDVEPFDGKGNIYVTINPCKPELLARAANRLQFTAKTTTSDNDILRDLWFIFDTDPLRPAEISSTDDELRAALAKRDDVAQFLSKWAQTLFGMSGNGGHGLIRLIGYPNNQETRQAKENLTHFLAEKFTDEHVSLDNTVFNMSRIWKLYGTIAVKGDDVPDRPYRRSHLNIPDPVPEPVDLYSYLDEIIPPEEKTESQPVVQSTAPKLQKPKKRKATDDYPLLDVPAYLNAWGGEWRIKEKGAVTWYQFRICPLHTDPDGDEWECGICQEASGKMGAKCMHEPSYGWQDFKTVLGDPKPFYRGESGCTTAFKSHVQAPASPPIPIHLTDIEKKEYEDKLVSTEVLLPGVGRDDSYFVPIAVEVECLKDNKNECSACPLESQDAIFKEFQATDRHLINFIKQTDAQVYAEIRRALGICKEASITVKEKNEVQVLLAMPKAGAELKKQGSKFVDEHGRDFREKLIYYSGVVPRSNTYYQVTGKVISDPRSQRATMLVEELTKLQNEYERFSINKHTKELLEAFQPEKDSLAAIEKKVKEIGMDIAYNIAGYFGEPRVNIAIADMLTWHSILQFEFDGKTLPRGWIDTMIFGDSGINKTEHLRTLRNAIGFGHFVDAGAVSRAGLLYSLDDILSGIRILRWGALPLNDGQLIIIDEAQNIHLDVWTEMSSARTTGVLVVTKAKQGEHPMRTRQIYTANPRPPNTMADFSFGIRGVKALMRPADIRRFDIVVCASRNEVSMNEINLLKCQREQTIQQCITPEHLSASIARAWTRRPEHIIWAEGAEAMVMDVASRLQRHFGAGDIPVIDVDAKDKVARIAVSLASWLVSTDESFEKVIVKPEHAAWVELYLCTIYSAQPAMLDKHALVASKMEQTSDIELTEIIEEWKKLNSPEPEHLAEMAILIAESEGIERDVLAAQVGVTPDTVTKLIRRFKEKRFVKSTRRGYFATPRLIEFYRNKYDVLVNISF
jgi:hypothetical protein